MGSLSLFIAVILVAMQTLKKSVYLFIILGIFLSISCGSKSPFNKDDDTPLKTADTFYKMLMWKYYDRAAAFVHHDQLVAYDIFTTENEDDLNITGYEIKDYTPIDEDNARVKVVLTFYRYPSVAEKKLTLWNEWNKINDAWFVNYEFLTTDFTRDELN